MIDYDAILAAVRTLFVGLFPAISSEDWVNLSAEDRAKLNKVMHTCNEVYNDKLRRPYDRTIWNGNKTGKFIGNEYRDDSNKLVATDQLRPVRTETVRKDSVKSEPVSADAMFDAIVGVETEEATA